MIKFLKRSKAYGALEYTFIIALIIIIALLILGWIKNKALVPTWLNTAQTAINDFIGTDPGGPVGETPTFNMLSVEYLKSFHSNGTNLVDDLSNYVLDSSNIVVKKNEIVLDSLKEVLDSLKEVKDPEEIEEFFKGLSMYDLDDYSIERSGNFVTFRLIEVALVEWDFVEVDSIKSTIEILEPIPDFMEVIIGEGIKVKHVSTLEYGTESLDWPLVQSLYFMLGEDDNIYYAPEHEIDLESKRLDVLLSNKVTVPDGFDTSLIKQINTNNQFMISNDGKIYTFDEFDFSTYLLKSTLPSSISIKELEIIGNPNIKKVVYDLEGRHFFFISGDGEVFVLGVIQSWETISRGVMGIGNEGQGEDDELIISEPRKLNFGSDKIKDISTDKYNTLFLTENGEVYITGYIGKDDLVIKRSDPLIYDKKTERDLGWIVDWWIHTPVKIPEISNISKMFTSMNYLYEEIFQIVLISKNNKVFMIGNIIEDGNRYNYSAAYHKFESFTELSHLNGIGIKEVFFNRGNFYFIDSNNLIYVVSKTKKESIGKIEIDNFNKYHNYYGFLFIQSKKNQSIDIRIGKNDDDKYFEKIITNIPFGNIDNFFYTGVMGSFSPVIVNGNLILVDLRGLTFYLGG